VSPRAYEIPAEPWPVRDVVLRDGTRLAVRATPEQDGTEPALMVHGLGGSSWNWTDLMALLADRLSSQAVDLPGFGFSPPPRADDYSLVAHARAVVGLLVEGGRAPVHLLANSLGGAVATIVASRRPDLVRTLTLISPALPDLRPGRYRTQVAVLAVPGVGRALSRRYATMPPEERVRGLLALVYADPSRVPAERLVAAAEEVERRSSLPHSVDALSASARGLLQAYLATGSRSLWQLASRVPVPTLLVYGRQDRLVSSQVAPKAKAAFPDATVVVLPHSGHVAQMEHPELVARLVRQHLDRAARAEALKRPGGKGGTA
jgi:pimeloyl-ACP methyl ester carboxylesterase